MKMTKSNRKRTQARSKRVCIAALASMLPSPTTTPCLRSFTRAVSFVSGGPGSLERRVNIAVFVTHQYTPGFTAQSKATHIRRLSHVVGAGRGGAKMTPILTSPKDLQVSTFLEKIEQNRDRSLSLINVPPLHPQIPFSWYSSLPARLLPSRRSASSSRLSH